MSRTIEGAQTFPRLPETDAATRREFLVGAASLLVLAPYGCGANGETGEDGSGETRTADTPRGPLEVPADPRRVLADYTHDLANALALGLPVIAGQGENGPPGAPFPRYLVDMFGEELAGVTRVAYLPEPNFERLAALRPDVILAGVFGGIPTIPSTGDSTGSRRR